MIGVEFQPKRAEAAQCGRQVGAGAAGADQCAAQDPTVQFFGRDAGKRGASLQGSDERCVELPDGELGHGAVFRDDTAF